MGISVSKSRSVQELNNRRKDKASSKDRHLKEDALNKQKNNRRINQSKPTTIHIDKKQEETKPLQLETNKNHELFPQIKKTQTNIMKQNLINEDDDKKILSQPDFQGHNFDLTINQNKQNFPFQPNNIHQYQTTLSNNKTIHISHSSTNRNQSQHSSRTLNFKAICNSSNKIQTDKFMNKQISQNLEYKNSQSFDKQIVFQKDHKSRLYEQKFQQSKNYEMKKSKTPNLQVWNIGIEGEQKNDNDKRLLMFGKGIVLSNKFSQNQQHFSEDQQLLKLPPLQIKKYFSNINCAQGGLKAISLRQHPQLGQSSQISSRKNHAPFI